MSIAIPVAFLILIVVILWLIIHLKGKFWIKLTFVSVATYYCIVLWYSLATFAGWSSGDDLPKEFQVKWIVIKEPSKKTGHDGAIYLWVSDIENKAESRNILNFLGYNAKGGEPRSFKVPYTRALHERAARAMGMLRRGIPVKGSALKGEKKDGAGKKGRRGARSGRGGNHSNKQEIEFHILPPARGQSKD
jgi:hypothetical protein